MAISDVTPESVDREKRYQAEQREIVRQRTGIQILDGPPYTLACPRCSFTASAMTDGGSVRALAGHLVGKHLRKAQKQK